MCVCCVMVLPAVSLAAQKRLQQEITWGGGTLCVCVCVGVGGWVYHSAKLL